jgi:serine/threonine protein kinase
VAVKITPTSVVRSACKEVTALTRLNNAHIVQLLGVQVKQTHPPPRSVGARGGGRERAPCGRSGDGQRGTSAVRGCARVAARHTCLRVPSRDPTCAVAECGWDAAHDGSRSTCAVVRGVALPRQVDMAEERVYMVMELCHGGELFDRIAECGGLAEDEAKRYFVQILHALSHCHENRVYHRDLKPENILLDAEDNAKVADFGLAAVYRHVAGSPAYLQHTKVGSVMYAAPEVLVSTAAQGYGARRATHMRAAYARVPRTRTSAVPCTG